MRLVNKMTFADLPTELFLPMPRVAECEEGDDFVDH
jgi:hypothetical protein